MMLSKPLVLVALVACAAMLAEASPMMREIELFKSGVGGYHTYRYERGRANPYESIAFATFSLEWLEGGDAGQTQ